MQYDTHTVEDLRTLAREFVGAWETKGSATVVTLSGELGAGKTTFVQFVAGALGVSETVSSPTFVIEKIYALEGQRFSRLIHIDAYRMKDEHELEVLGWDEIVKESDNLILIEWPERVPNLIPKDAIKVRFDILGDGHRITIDGGQKVS